jgi:putative transposase
MPWKVSDVMEQRYALIERWRSGEESVAELARRYQLSRKTIYKWMDRFEEEGRAGLGDQSRRPHRQALRTPAEDEQWILDLRHAHPTWGPKKLRSWLERHHPEQEWPARSTIGLILKRHGLSSAQPKRRRATASPGPLAPPQAVNDLWCVDFKGWFLCGNGECCQPLTMTDGLSRYLLCCRDVTPTRYAEVRRAQTAVFRQYGLPVRLRSDNGPPFATTGVGGLSRLSVWWIHLGILPERIEPGQPQQNGTHERMHRTLKRETARPPASSAARQHQRLQNFVQEYNHERPHEALQGACPADLYRPSKRPFPEKLPELVYPAGRELRRADESGKIRWKQARCRVSQALAHEVLAVEPIGDGVSRVWFGPVLLGVLDERDGYSKTRKKDFSYWPPLQSPSGLLARRPAADQHGEEPAKV